MTKNDQIIDDALTSLIHTVINDILSKYHSGKNVKYNEIDYLSSLIRLREVAVKSYGTTIPYIEPIECTSK